MSVELHVALKPPPGVAMSPGPWRTRDDGTVIAADGTVVCVLGTPEEDLGDQDAANGAAILALPELIAELAQLTRTARTVLRTDGPGFNLMRACRSAETALAKAGRKP